MSVVTAEAVAERLDAVRARIAAAAVAAGRDGSDVRIVAVTKGFGPDAIAAAVAAGCLDIGENYAQELLSKAAAAVGPAPTVHFIGRLQTNKVRSLAPVVDVWQTVDRPGLVAAIVRHAPGASVMVQVSVSGQPQQGGCAPADCADLVEKAVAGGLDVIGLMAIGDPAGGEAARPGFARLRRLADDIGLAECSMGMSADLEVAVQEGSTMVRVGSALFGVRPLRAQGN